MASQRTKNRVHEHSDHWIFTGRTNPGIPSSEYRECRDQEVAHMFCERDNKNPDCDWQGWLPIAELEELGHWHWKLVDGNWVLK